MGILALAMPGLATHWMFKLPVGADELLIVLEFDLTCVPGAVFEEDALGSNGFFDTPTISGVIPCNLLDLFWLCQPQNDMTRW